MMGVELKGKELKARREERKWTQQQVANALGREQALVSQWERGLKNPNVCDAKLLSEIFETGDLPEPPVTRKKKKPDVGAGFVENHKFEPGKRYRVAKCEVVFLRKEGRHYIFRGARARWLTSWTDEQLVGEEVRAA